MKKMLMVVVVLCMVSAMFAVDFSLGGKVGLGVPVLRGADAEAYLDAFPSDVDEFSNAFSANIDALIEFTPFFALESGLGFIASGGSYSIGEPATALYAQNIVGRGELYIPVLARVQTEYDMGSIGGVSYFAIGAQVGINIVGDQGYLAIGVGEDYLNTVPLADASPVNFDIPIAIGQEFRFGTNHYVGLRAQYNINLTSPIEPSAGLDPADWFHDSVMGMITYRYAF